MSNWMKKRMNGSWRGVDLVGLKTGLIYKPSEVTHIRGYTSSMYFSAIVVNNSFAQLRALLALVACSLIFVYSNLLIISATIL